VLFKNAVFASQKTRFPRNLPINAFTETSAVFCENCKKLINEGWGKMETFEYQSDATYGNGCGVCS
jgi:Pyruvate/2-oxoacid:ferredoxin oxidoreductase delta subunit